MVDRLLGEKRCIQCKSHFIDITSLGMLPCGFHPKPQCRSNGTFPCCGMIPQQIYYLERPGARGPPVDLTRTPGCHALDHVDGSPREEDDVWTARPIALIPQEVAHVFSFMEGVALDSVPLFSDWDGSAQGRGKSVLFRVDGPADLPLEPIRLERPFGRTFEVDLTEMHRDMWQQLSEEEVLARIEAGEDRDDIEEELDINAAERYFVGNPVGLEMRPFSDMEDMLNRQGQRAFEPFVVVRRMATDYNWNKLSIVGATPQDDCL